MLLQRVGMGEAEVERFLADQKRKCVLERFLEGGLEFIYYYYSTIPFNEPKRQKNSGPLKKEICASRVVFLKREIRMSRGTL